MFVTSYKVALTIGDVPFKPRPQLSLARTAVHTTPAHTIVAHLVRWKGEEEGEEKRRQTIRRRDI